LKKKTQLEIYFYACGIFRRGFCEIFDPPQTLTSAVASVARSQFAAFVYFSNLFLCEAIKNSGK